jgi:iron complex transport system substrate-binding protein
MLRKSLLLTFIFLLSLWGSACGPAPQATQAVTSAPAVETLPPTLAAEVVATQVVEPSATAEAAVTQAPEPTGETSGSPGDAGRPAAAITLTDGLQRTVRLEGPAQRVVSLAASNTEILFAIGAGAQVAGRDEFSDAPAEAAALPSVGGSFGEYNQEAIVDLKPDLVLAAEINTAEQVQALESLGLTVYYLSNPTDLDGMFQNLMIVAEMTGHEAETQQLVETLRARVEAVEAKIQTVTERPLVFYEVDATNPGAPYTVGSGTFVDTLIQMAGGENLGARLEGPYPQASLEVLVVEDPQVILLGDAVWGGITPEAVAQRAGWEQLSAVQENRVYPFDDNLASRPGPRLVDGLEAMAKLLHPDLFDE